VPAILQRGEFVIRRGPVARIGVAALAAENRGDLKSAVALMAARLHQGGQIGSSGSTTLERFHEGGSTVRSEYHRQSEFHRDRQTFREGGLKERTIRTMVFVHSGGSIPPPASMSSAVRVLGSLSVLNRGSLVKLSKLHEGGPAYEADDMAVRVRRPSYQQGTRETKVRIGLDRRRFSCRCHYRTRTWHH
jgi:hypothetical protein